MKKLNGLVILVKNDGDIKLCMDRKDLNKSIVKHPCSIVRATVFCTLDNKDGFWHIKLSETSSKLCTFNSLFERFQFLKLPYGLLSRSEMFQR